MGVPPSRPGTAGQTNNDRGFVRSNPGHDPGQRRDKRGRFVIYDLRFTISEGAPSLWFCRVADDCDGATMNRAFSAREVLRAAVPRALPWAGMSGAVGAGIQDRRRVRTGRESAGFRGSLRPGTCLRRGFHLRQGSYGGRDGGQAGRRAGALRDRAWCSRTAIVLGSCCRIGSSQVTTSSFSVVE